MPIRFDTVTDPLLPPKQLTCETAALTGTVSRFTITVSFAVIGVPYFVAVKIYVVVAAGVETGLLIVVELNPVAGLHE